MPTYTIRNKEFGTEKDVFCTYSELQDMLKNKSLEHVITAPAIVSGIEGKTFKEDSGFRENMQRIAEAHPNSALAEMYGTNRTNKDIKTFAMVKLFTGIRNPDILRLEILPEDPDLRVDEKNYYDTKYKKVRVYNKGKFVDLDFSKKSLSGWNNL